MPDDADDEDLDRARRIEERRSSRGRSRGQSERSQASQASNTHNSTEDSVSSDSSQTSNTQDNDKKSQGSQMSETAETNNSSAVRDQTHVAMYLDDELAEELDIRFHELQMRYRREHGEKMQKNRDFYPALARSAINGTGLLEELGLEDDE